MENLVRFFEAALGLARFGHNNSRILVHKPNYEARVVGRDVNGRVRALRLQRVTIEYHNFC